MSVDDIDLDVDLKDVEGGDGFLIEPGRYLMKIVDMERRKTKNGDCFMYTTEILDTMDEKHMRHAKRSAKVYEIINVEPDSKQLWRLKELLGGAFGIKSGKKIPADIKGRPFTALVFVDDFGGDERNKLKNHKSGNNWEGIKYTVSSDGELTAIADKPNGSKSTGSSSKGSTKPADDSEDELEI